MASRSSPTTADTATACSRPRGATPTGSSPSAAATATSTPSTRSRRDGGGSLVTAALLDRELTFTIAQRGDHWVSNSLAVLAAVEAVGADVAVAGLALADMGGLKGRGERHRSRSRAATRC